MKNGKFLLSNELKSVKFWFFSLLMLLLATSSCQQSKQKIEALYPPLERVDKNKLIGIWEGRSFNNSVPEWYNEYKSDGTWQGGGLLRLKGNDLKFTVSGNWLLDGNRITWDTQSASDPRVEFYSGVDKVIYISDDKLVLKDESDGSICNRYKYKKFDSGIFDGNGYSNHTLSFYLKFPKDWILGSMNHIKDNGDDQDEPGAIKKVFNLFNVVREVEFGGEISQESLIALGEKSYDDKFINAKTYTMSIMNNLLKEKQLKYKIPSGQPNEIILGGKKFLQFNCSAFVEGSEVLQYYYITKIENNFLMFIASVRGDEGRNIVSETLKQIQFKELADAM